MNNRTMRACYVALAIVLSSLISCKDKAPANADSSKPESAKEMADMPGMKMGEKSGEADEKSSEAGVVLFNAAQVQHGKVSWEPVAMSTAASTAIVPGQLIPNEDRTARLGAPAQGRVTSVRVSPGDRVEQGHVLVTMQSPEAGLAQSDVAKAQAEVTARQAAARYARTARDRAERLLTLKAIPRQDVERAIADDEAARSALTQAEAELRRARSLAGQLEADGASASGEIALRSPLAGVILQRLAAPGSVVEAGAPLVVVTDPSTLWVQVSAPEQFAGLFRPGTQLRFSVSAYPGEVFTARVTAIGAGLDPSTRTLPIRAIATSAGKLKAEMLASVHVEGSSRVPAVVLPEDAVQLMDGKTTVFLATPDGKGGARLQARVVITGSRSAGRIAVLQGLSAGDVVVTRGAVAVRSQLKKGSMPEMEM